MKANAMGLRDEERPKGCFMFLGPTGVGKTRLCKAMAEALYGDKDKLLVFDMAEYSERHTLSRLLGSPPGYVGYRTSGGILTERVAKEKELVILFDELEKAAPEVVKLLLGINETGYVTSGSGRRVTLRNCVIVATGNVGSKEISALSAAKLGFRLPKRDDNDSTGKDYEKMKKVTLDELKNAYNAEFVNRWDDIVIFNKLTRSELADTINVMLNDIYHGRITATDDARKAIVDLSYNDVNNSPDVYGARPIRRIIQNLVADEGFAILVGSPNAKAVITLQNGKPTLKSAN